MISINTGVDGIFYPPLPLKSQKKRQKKAITILSCTILLLIGFVFLLDKTVIFRISFDSNNASLAMPEILPVLYQGAIDDPKNSMLCYIDRSEDVLTVIDCNPFKRRNETWDYLFNPAVYIDGIPVEYRLGFRCPINKMIRFWKANVNICFYYNSKRELCSEVNCDDCSNMDSDGYSDCFTCTITQ